VRDTGIGIPADHLTSIFEMFSQVTPALERSQGGLGIGLSLVKGLVELHGGTIDAHSAGLSLGSEFLVRLPANAEAADESSNGDAQSRHAAGGQRRKILVVDDNVDSANTMSRMLSILGHEVETAFDGLEAVNAAAAFRPEIVLLDIGLPRMNGYEVAEQIRQQSWGTDMVLIAQTGWGQQEDKQRAIEAGFDHHLTKPLDVAELLKLIAAVRPRRETARARE
jgi:CheY-like chemotaxis protein